MRTHQTPYKYADNMNWFFHYRKDISEEKKIPQELIDIQDKWFELSSHEGDVGCCVLGACMQFKYKDRWYCMAPASPFQGEGSWTPFVELIKEMLENIGCTKITWYCGRMD